MTLNTSPSLNELAVELRMLIISHMEPKELVTFGQTCRNLHELVSDRSVWEAVLLSVCREYSLFEPSFPFESMDVAHLRRAALGPTLWQERLMNSNQNPLVPSQSQIRLKGQGTPRVLRIPGDRYFIASTSSNIELWDLGIPYAKGSQKKPTLVGEINADAGFSIINLFDLLPHGSHSVRFGVTARHHQTDEDSIFVYEAGSLPDRRAFRRLVKVQYSTWGTRNSGPQIFSLCGDKLIFANMDKIAVWDFVAGHRVWWKTPDAELSGFAPHILRFSFVTFEDLVLLVKWSSLIVGWKIPPFRKARPVQEVSHVRDLFSDDGLEEQVRRFRLRASGIIHIPIYMWTPNDHPIIDHTPPCWYNRTLRNRYFFSAVANAMPEMNGSHVVMNYQLDLPSNEDQSPPHLSLLSSRLLSVTNQRPYTQFLTAINPWFTIGLHTQGSGSLLWRTVEHSKVIDSPTWQVTIPLEDSCDISDMSPCMGRVLYTRNNSNCVHIVDFI